jgi:ComF family protein
MESVEKNTKRNTKVNTKVNKLGKSVSEGLKIIYPPSCPMCGEILADRTLRACPECIRRLHFVGSPCCARCGKEIADDEAEYCDACTEKPRSYIKGFPAVEYDAEINSCMMGFKYGGKKGYADFLASLIVKRQGQAILAVKPDVLLPVPIHKARLKKRGYNQAELLAKSLSTYLGIPYDSKLLIREKNTQALKTMDGTAREQNLKNAFNLSSKSVEYSRVLLVDDIYTTGATIEGCTRVLESNGLREVFYTSVCIGKGC